MTTFEKGQLVRIKPSSLAGIVLHVVRQGNVEVVYVRTITGAVVADTADNVELSDQCSSWPDSEDGQLRRDLDALRAENVRLRMICTICPTMAASARTLDELSMLRIRNSELERQAQIWRDTCAEALERAAAVLLDESKAQNGQKAVEPSPEQAHNK